MSELLPTPIEKIGMRPPPKANVWVQRAFLVALPLTVIGVMVTAPLLWGVFGPIALITGGVLFSHHVHNPPQPATPESMFSPPGHWDSEEFVPDMVAPMRSFSGSMVPPETPAERTQPIAVVRPHSHGIFRRDLSRALKTTDPDESRGEIRYSDRVNAVALVGIMARPLSFLVVVLTLNLGLLVPANRPGTIRFLAALFVAIVVWELLMARFGRRQGLGLTRLRRLSDQDEGKRLTFRTWLVSIVVFALAAAAIPYGTWLLVVMLVVVTYFTVRGYLMWSRTYYVIKGTLFYRRRRLPWLFGGTDFKRIDIPKIDTVNSDQSWWEQFLGLNSATLKVDTPSTGDEWATVRYIKDVDKLTNWIDKLMRPQPRTDPNTKLLGEIRDILGGQPPRPPQS